MNFDVLVGIFFMIWFWGGLGLLAFDVKVLKNDPSLEVVFIGGFLLAVVYFFLCVTFFTLKAIFFGG